MIRYFSLMLLALTFLPNFTYSQEIRNPRISFFSSIIFENSHKIFYKTNNLNEEVSPNFLFGGEIIVLNNDKFDKFGIGINYQLKSNSLDSAGKFSYWPVYFFSRYQLLSHDEFNLNLQFSIGYNFFNVDADSTINDEETVGGLYYSFGIIQMINNKIQLRLMYSVNYGILKISGDDYLVKNSFVSLGIGYNF